MILAVLALAAFVGRVVGAAVALAAFVGRVVGAAVGAAVGEVVVGVVVVGAAVGAAVGEVVVGLVVVGATVGAAVGEVVGLVVVGLIVVGGRVVGRGVGPGERGAVIGGGVEASQLPNTCSIMAPIRPSPTNCDTPSTDTSYLPSPYWQQMPSPSISAHHYCELGFAARAIVLGELFICI